MIHICSSYYSTPNDTFRRSDLEPCEKTLAAYERLKEIDIEPEFHRPYPGRDIKFEVVGKPDGGSVVFAIEVGKDVGALMLVLSGLDSKAEQRACISFQARTWGKSWSLPIPPLEIERRPLLYYVRFQLNDDPTGFADAILDQLPLMNAYGMAVIESQGVTLQ